jgi:hypothetical protein
MGLTPVQRRRIEDAAQARVDAQQEFEDAMVAGYKAGASFRELAEASGMSHTAAGRMLERLGVHHVDRIPPEVLEEAKRIWAERQARGET